MTNPTQFGTDLTPTCDRCGQPATHALVMDIDTMTAICSRCLTPEEILRLTRGERHPLNEDDDQAEPGHVNTA